MEQKNSSNFRDDKVEKSFKKETNKKWRKREEREAEREPKIKKKASNPIIAGPTKVFKQK